ncbi:MAG TPA: pentapeptide repeat-containing protein [Nannocystis sp.]|jgi:uncharacterized protein YjbI with pentapeptide repeats
MAALTRDDVHRAVGSASDRGSFAGQDLTGIDLSTHVMRQADFSRASLRNADLHGARLDGCDFSSARLDHADLAGASLRNAWFKAASLVDADLRDADLTGAFLGQADLGTAKLRGAWFGGVELSGTELPANWRHITRVQHVPDRPYDRADIIAAVRRDLADDDPEAALITLVRMLETRDVDALLELLRATPDLTTLPELRAYELPAKLHARICELTTPPLDETAAELARLARHPLATCQTNGLRWTMTQVIRNGGVAPVVLLRQITGLPLHRAKSLAGFASEQPEATQQTLGLAETGDLSSAAALLTFESHDLDFDLAVRTLWCLRESLRPR